MTASNDDEIMYHHGTSDPTDYQVDDVLVCVAAGHGLAVGEHYLAHAVEHRRACGRVVTTVTVSSTNDFDLVEVVEADAFLRRTRVLVDVIEPSGRVRRHSFPDPEELAVWCAFTRVPADRIRNQRYVPAEPTPPASGRFTAMCVPGELDDGSDANWYVYDLVFRTSDKVGVGPQCRSLAIWTAREANRVQNESDREEAGHEPR